MDLRDRMAGIDANLDDLQSGLEACLRAADALHTESAKFDAILKQIEDAPVIGSLVRHAADIQACARDQRAALRELRRGIARLQEELRIPSHGMRPPPDVAADRRHG